jgi:hypothetical protein
MTESPSTAHNRALCANFLAKAKVYSRYPRVSERAECTLLDKAGLPPFAYNPSVFQSARGMWMAYRYHFSGDFRTRLGIITIGQEPKAQDLPLSGHSQEDARLFSFHGETWMSWVESTFNGQSNPTSVVRYAQLEDGWKISRIYEPAKHVNDGKGMQKNWCFFESDENLFCIYDSWPQQIVFQIQGDTVVNEYKTDGVRWPYGLIRGGNIVPHDGKLLRFFHSKTLQGISGREERYFVGCCLLEPKPPFAMLAVSGKPIVYGSEIDDLKPSERKACHHWKRNVVFPCGAIADGENFILSVGVNDSAGLLVKIKPEQLNL